MVLEHSILRDVEKQQLTINRGTIGLYISDRAEKKLGFEPTPAEQEAWAATLPKITTIERNDGKS